MLGFPGLWALFLYHVLDHFSSISTKYVLYFIIITFIPFFYRTKIWFGTISLVCIRHTI